MRDMREIDRQYHNDASFHQMVVVIRNALEKLALSPGEVREAAMFACYHFELEHPKPVIIGNWELTPRTEP